MKVNKTNFKQYKKIKQQLVDYLSKQSVRLPEDWTGPDHAMLVLETVVGQYRHMGFDKDMIREEFEVVLDMGNNTKRLQ